MRRRRKKRKKKMVKVKAGKSNYDILPEGYFEASYVAWFW